MQPTTSIPGCLSGLSNWHFVPKRISHGRSQHYQANTKCRPLSGPKVSLLLAVGKQGRELSTAGGGGGGLKHKETPKMHTAVRSQFLPSCFIGYFEELRGAHQHLTHCSISFICQSGISSFVLLLGALKSSEKSAF